MIRKPRTEQEIYRWHRETMEHIALHGEKDRSRPPMHEGEPEAGWYRRRLVPKGAFVPARIWIEPPETDPETGDQVAPEKMLCEVDGKRVDVFRAWTWLAQHPISEDQYFEMKAGGFRALAPDQEVATVKFVATELTEPMAPIERSADGPVKVVESAPPADVKTCF